MQTRCRRRKSAPSVTSSDVELSLEDLEEISPAEGLRGINGNNYINQKTTDALQYDLK